MDRYVFPRLHILLARESKNAIIIRRGPSKKTAIIGWDRNTDNFLNKIKKPADLLYEKQTNGVAGPAGNDAYSRNLAISGDTQSIPNITQIPPEVKQKRTEQNQAHARALYNLIFPNAGEMEYHRQQPMSRV